MEHGMIGERTSARGQPRNGFRYATRATTMITPAHRCTLWRRTAGPGIGPCLLAACWPLDWQILLLLASNGVELLFDGLKLL